MPELSRFYGIVIEMNYDDHAPPHFHAKYSGDEGTVDISSLEVTGRLPNRPLRRVLEWASIHQDELLDRWERASRHEPLPRIAPLP